MDEFGGWAREMERKVLLMRANRSNFTLGRHQVKHDVHLDGQIVALQRQDVQFEAHFI